MKSIYVRNLGPIREAEIDINRFTVLIGEQASGKSTLAKLVYFFKSLKDQLVQLGLSTDSEVDGYALTNAIRDQFYIFFGSTKKLPEDYVVEFRYDDNRVIKCSGSPLSIEITPRDWFYSLLEDVRSFSIRIATYRDRNDLIGETRERYAYFEALKRQFDDQQESLYLPASRNITVSYSDSFLATLREELRLKTAPLTSGRRNDAKAVDLLIMRDFISHVEQVRERFKGMGIEEYLRGLPPQLSESISSRIQRLLKGKYRYSANTGEYFRIFNRGQVLLEHASSGQQESIRILQDVLVTLKEKRNVFRVIEEPEAHLFPTGQRALIEILSTLATASQPSSLLITTHSPYILSVLNNLVYASQVPPMAAEEAGFPNQIRLKREWLSAYMINQDGIAESIIDEETGLIGTNLIENAWDEINYSFQQLYSLDD